MSYGQMYKDLMKAMHAEYPNREDFTTYYAYKGGKSKLFQTRNEASEYSEILEINFDKQAYDAAYKKYYEIQHAASDKVIQAMKSELGYGDNEKDTKLFNLIYSKADEAGHSSGFDEIYNYLLEFDDLVRRAIYISNL